MNAAVAHGADDLSRPTPVPTLRTLVLCDLVDSTALVERVGDARAVALFRRHDRAARDLIAAHRGHEIDKTDGFLLLFDRPIEALGFALDYQRLLRDLSREEGIALKARVGAHVGEVTVYENEAEDVARGAKRVEVEGLVKPVAARLMGLALPGQILVSGMLFGLAQRAESELKPAFPNLRWKFHGHYAFKGVPQAMPIHEIGEPGVAPLLRPVATDKAWRARPLLLRPRALLAELAVVAAAAVVVLFVTTRTQPAIAFAERDWVVVGELRNLTGDPVFDESLETALRISLEQSRFVNIVPDLQVRDVLTRMRRDPASPLDRTLGAEVALREGARALLLPTVAEVGGRLRVSAELIDPATQTTVYAESADGSGAASALDSVDRVTRTLRNRLGEAMAQIERDSAPLPKATTANLDALRAYALGNDAYFANDHPRARALFQQAIELDPEFALAHAGLGRILLSSHNNTAPTVALDRALALAQRLPPRERLYIAALRANLGPPVEALSRWRAYADAYPDAFNAHANYAMVAANSLNRHSDAIRAARNAVSERYPRSSHTHYQLGHYHVALEEFDDALREFAAAVSGGERGELLFYAGAHAARRNFAEADRMLGTGGLDSSRESAVLRAIVALDRGRWSQGLEALRAVGGDSSDPLLEHTSVVRLLILESFEPQDDYARRLSGEIAALQREADASVEAVRAHYVYLRLLVAAAAAKHDRALAERVLGQHADRAAHSGYPRLGNLVELLEAEIELARGNAAGAASTLAKIEPDAPLLLRFAQARALFEAGDARAAARASERLAGHRGRAYGEISGLGALRAYHVVSTSLALLDAARAYRAIGDAERADDALRRFREAWPDRENDPDFVTRRIAAASGEISSR